MHTERITTVKMSILPKVLCRFIAITLTNQMAFFTGLGKNSQVIKNQNLSNQPKKTQIKTKVLGLTMYHRARDEAPQLVEYSPSMHLISKHCAKIKTKMIDECGSACLESYHWRQRQEIKSPRSFLTIQLFQSQSKLQETFSQGIIKKEKYITQAVTKQYNIDIDNVTKQFRYKLIARHSGT